MVSVQIVARNRFPQLIPLINSRIAAAIEDGANEIVAIAQGLVPVRTGALKASIAATLTEMYAASVSADAGHAIYVEYGTRFMAAQPFLLPAAEAVMGSFGRTFAGFVGGIGAE